MAKKNIKTASKKKKAKKYFDSGQHNEALELYLKITQLDFRDADAFYMSGVLYGMQGEKQLSIGQLQKAIELRPSHALSHYNLGITYRDLGQFEDALKEFRLVVKLQPDYIENYNTLAHVYINLKKFDEAVETFKKLISLQPNDADTYSNMGTVLQAQGKLSESIDCYEIALKLKPKMTTAWDSLGSALTLGGQYEEALQAYRESLKQDAKNARGYSNLLLTLNYMSEFTAQQVFEEHKKWGLQYATKKPSLKKSCDAISRPLRIAYISPDFRSHSVAYFIEPLLESHNTALYETWCYSSVPNNGDETTERLKLLATQWRDISEKNCASIVEQIRRDEIDILVDLSGHTSSNHLDVFLHKPAPVQVTWLGYPNTTGMETMDYRFVDAITDPEGSENFCSETLLRLENCFICYKPPQSAPDVRALPCEKNNFITFGSFNNLAKMGLSVIRLWIDILKMNPQYRLLIKNPSLTDSNTRARYTEYFLSAGVHEKQIELMGHTSSRDAHLDLYNRVDIALDTFPYNGTTTSCEALWMGVPVITLKGDCHAARVSASLLKNVNLEELVAQTAEEYVSIASALAENKKHLHQLRSGLRERMMNSVLCDQKQFALNMEGAYKKIWEEKCS